MRACRLMMLAGMLPGMLMGLLALSACNVTTPSQLYTGKLRVSDQMVAETLSAGTVDPARVGVIADRFMQNGKGEMVLTVSYLSGDSAGKTAAEKNGKAYKKAFEQRGASNISVVTVPVADKQYADQLVATYRAATALSPKGCRRLPGYHGGDDMAAIDQYQFGCDTQTMLGRMVSNPADLLGKAGTQDSDSRRSGTLTEPYKTGKPNAKMQGYQASGIGG